MLHACTQCQPQQLQILLCGSLDFQADHLLCMCVCVLQVNASPSMTSTTAADRLLKWQVVHDALSIVVPPQQQQRQPQQQQGSTSISTDTGSSPLKPAAGKQAAQQHSRQPYPCAAGCMQLIHMEAQESSSKKAKRARKLPGKPNKDAVTGSTVAAAAHKRAVLRG